MFKKLFTVFVLSLFMTSLILAQSATKLIHSKKLVEENSTSTFIFKNNPPHPIINGESIGVTTNYDYFSNSIIRDQIVYDEVNDVVHCFNMVRPWQGANTRNVVHSFKSGGTWTNQSVSNGAGGWPHIDLGRTGASQGFVGMVWHTPTRLSIWDGATGYFTNQIEGTGSLDPSLQLAGDNIWIATSGARTQYKFYKSTDFGVTFELWDSISGFAPSIYWKAYGSVEVGMSKSKNEQYLAYFATNEGEGHVFNGVPEDSADNFWIVFSSDGGNNWTGRMIGFDGKLDQVQNYLPNYAPLFENFGQVDLAISNNGVFHAVANGYGLVLNEARDSAIAAAFPVLYWNSSTNQWVSISDLKIDTIQAILSYFPTNSIGQAYPSIAVSDDGQVIYVLWTGPQLTEEGTLDTANNGAGTTYYWRDLYHAYSVDGGATWNYGGVFPGMSKTLSEVFGTVAQHLQKVDDQTYRAHIIYLADQTTGVGPFDNVLTNNDLIYTTFDIPLTSVKSDNNVVKTFELSQNYPNPFNPTTTIRFTIPEKSLVTLKVFDMLGREVSTLVNEVKDAGTHTVKFAGKDLPSGMYLYTITAGNYTATKKMMLVK